MPHTYYYHALSVHDPAHAPLFTQPCLGTTIYTTLPTHHYFRVSDADLYIFEPLQTLWITSADWHVQILSQRPHLRSKLAWLCIYMYIYKQRV